MQHCYVGKAVSITYAECVSVPEVSNIQCACVILSSVARPALLYFPPYLIKGRFSGEKISNIIYEIYFLNKFCLKYISF